MSERIRARLQGWRAIHAVVGLGQVAVGLAMLIDGPPFGDVFDLVNLLPWWGWGTWAMVGGLCILNARVAVAGLASAALWYTFWAAGLAAGILNADGPLYAIFVYLTLACIHIIVSLVHAFPARIAK